MPLNVEHLIRVVETLDLALTELRGCTTGDPRYDLYRNAAIKSFELSLETAGKLMRKALKAFAGSPREVDRLVFNDVLRHCGKHGLLDLPALERWLAYRANRNNTAHDYGEEFANQTLTLLPHYVQDVRDLALKLQGVFDAAA